MTKYKFAILCFLFACNSNVFAEQCHAKTVKDSELITLFEDEDQSVNIVHIRVPDTYDGKPLASLIFSGSTGDTKNIKEVSMPLSIKSKGAHTGSYFYVSPNWLKIEISAVYGDSSCSSELSRPYNKSHHSQP